MVIGTIVRLVAAAASVAATAPNGRGCQSAAARSLAYCDEALGLAARSGNAAMVMALLDAGADRAAVMKNGKTAGEIARLNKNIP